MFEYGPLVGNLWITFIYLPDNISKNIKKGICKVFVLSYYCLIVHLVGLNCLSACYGLDLLKAKKCFPSWLLINITKIVWFLFVHFGVNKFQICWPSRFIIHWNFYFKIRLLSFNLTYYNYAYRNILNKLVCFRHKGLRYGGLLPGGIILWKQAILNWNLKKKNHISLH